VSAAALGLLALGSGSVVVFTSAAIAAVDWRRVCLEDEDVIGRALVVSTVFALLTFLGSLGVLVARAAR
jgi:hypothetical protein